MKDLFRVRSANDAYWLKEKIRRFSLSTVARRKGLIDFTNAVLHTPYHIDTDYEVVHDKDRMLEEAETTRAAFARMIDSLPSQVLLDTNTTRSLDHVLKLLRRNNPEKTSILSTDKEYGSMTQVIQASGLEHGTVPVETLEDRVAETEADIIFFPHVIHDGTQILPVKKITEKAREAGKYVIIDAAQSIGQFPVSAPELGVNALVGCGHKWLAGQTVSGFAYMEDGFNELKKTLAIPYAYPGEINTDLLDYDGPVAIYGLMHVSRAIAMRDDWNHEFKRITELGEYARRVLEDNPHIDMIDSPRLPPGMVAFNSDIPDLRRRLEKGRTMITIAQKGETQYRISFMSTNFPAEIEIFDAKVKQLGREDYDSSTQYDEKQNCAPTLAMF